MEAILINFDQYITSCANLALLRQLINALANSIHLKLIQDMFSSCPLDLWKDIRNYMTFTLCIVKNIYLKLMAPVTKLNISGNQTFQRLLSLNSYCKLSLVSFLAHCNTLMNL